MSVNARACTEYSRFEMESRRLDAARSVVRCARGVVAAGPLSRDLLELLKIRLDKLAAEKSLWSLEDFPPPPAGETCCHYWIAGEPDNGITLYLNVMCAGRSVAPHDHSSWAVLAAVSGLESHQLYRRTDKGGVSDGAILQRESAVDLAPGNSLVMMPGDIHSTSVECEGTVCHLHLYGQALEAQQNRTRFEYVASIYKRVEIVASVQG